MYLKRNVGFDYSILDSADSTNVKGLYEKFFASCDSITFLEVTIVGRVLSKLGNMRDGIQKVINKVVQESTGYCYNL